MRVDWEMFLLVEHTWSRRRQEFEGPALKHNLCDTVQNNELHESLKNVNKEAALLRTPYASSVRRKCV